MGKNKKEQFIFTLMMCAFMVFGMTLYNVFLIKGFSNNFFKEVISGYLPGFLVALILDIFVVGKLAKALNKKIMKEDTKLIKKILFMSFLMVSGMVLCMSFYGVIINVGFSAELPKAYLKGILHNFIVALPLQLIIVSPIVRTIFKRIYG